MSSESSTCHRGSALCTCPGGEHCSPMCARCPGSEGPGLCLRRGWQGRLEGDQVCSAWEAMTREGRAREGSVWTWGRCSWDSLRSQRAALVTPLSQWDPSVVPSRRGPVT